MKTTTTVRNIPQGDLDKLSLLVGHGGHTSQSDAIRKAIAAYIRLNNGLINQLEKG